MPTTIFQRHPNCGAVKVWTERKDILKGNTGTGPDTTYRIEYHRLSRKRANHNEKRIIFFLLITVQIISCKKN